MPGKCLATSFTQTKPASAAAAVSCATPRSLVQIEQVNPNGVLFTSASMACGSSQRSTESTGPKISSRAIVMSWVTPAKTVGSMKQPPASAGSAGGPPPATSRAPSAWPRAM